MNRLEARIADSETGDGATLLRLEVQKNNLYALIMERSGEPYFKVGHTVKACFKETSVFLFKKQHRLTPSKNCFQGTVTDKQEGELFDRYQLALPVGEIFSIFPKSITHFSNGESTTIYLPPHDITLWDSTGSHYG
jgi:molybdopterin-binding protein